MAPVSGLRVLAVLLVAACAMVAWDVAMEPVWSTLLHCWVWRGGGVYFGAPLSNFFGWYLTVYIFYQLFVLYLSRQPATASLPRTYWRMVVIFYALCAAGNLLVALPPSSAALVTDPAGVVWHVSAITRACALASLAGMGSFVLLSARKLRRSS